MFLAELLAGAAQEDRLPPPCPGDRGWENCPTAWRGLPRPSGGWQAGGGNCGHGSPCLPVPGERGRTGPPWTGRWAGRLAV